MTSNLKSDKKRKITDYTIKGKEGKELIKRSILVKRTFSSVSPVEGDRKKGKHTMESEGTTAPTVVNKGEELKDVIGPLVVEMKMLRESMDNRITKLEDAIATQRQEVTEEIHKLEETVTSHRDTATEELQIQVKENQQAIGSILNKNKILR